MIKSPNFLVWNVSSIALGFNTQIKIKFKSIGVFYAYLPKSSDPLRFSEKPLNWEDVYGKRHEKNSDEYVKKLCEESLKISE